MIRLVILLMLFSSLPAEALVDTGANVEYVPGTSSMGIGVSSPNTKLTINGGMAFKEIATQGATLNYGKVYVNSSNHKLYFKDNGGVAYNLVNGSSAGSSAAAGSDTYFQFNNGGNLGGNGALTFTKSTKTLLVPADAPLDIDSTTVSIADPIINFDGASTTFSSTGALSLISSGTGVGIQKTSPSYALDVNGTTFSKAWNFNGNTMSIGSLSQGSILFAKVDGSLSALDNGAASDHKVLRVNGNALVWEALSSTGDVTGGSSSVVNGLPIYTSATGKAIGDSGVSLLTRSAQSLYIGNGSGAYTANGTTLRNTALGFNAMRGGTSFTGDDNVAIGMNGLMSITSGSNNVALGYNALYSDTTGSSNVAIGSRALRTNTTGGQSVAIGADTLNGNISGSNAYNVAIGYHSSWRGTATQTVGVGAFALNGNTAGISVGIGYKALYSNTSGSGNVGVGSNALNFNVTGSDNTALGYYAGEGTSGSSFSRCVFVGSNTGLSLTTGNGNVMVGYNAGTAVTNGNGNTLLGYQAGDAITTGARNIVIGYDIDAPSATGRGQLTIGNLIFGNGLTATSGTTVSGGKVGINKAQPSYTLDINGTTFSKAWNFNGNTMSLPTLSQGSILFAKVGGSLSVLDNGASSDHKALKVNGNTLAWEAIPAGGDVTGGSSSAVNGLPIYTSSSGKAIGYSAVKLITRSQQSLYIGNGSGAYTANNATLRNTALGYDAMKGGAGFTGDNNIAVGMNGLLSVTSGYDNVAVGYNALRANTTGFQNVAVGASALASNTTGNGNIAIGYQALFHSGGGTSFTGTGNIGIGYQPLRGVTTGSYNIALGYIPGSVSTGSHNIAMGYQTFGNNATGSHNIALGYEALGASSATSNNIAVGYISQRYATTGSSNVAVGYETLSNNLTGSDNVVFGYMAGNGTTGNSFSRAVLVGREAGAITNANGGVMLGYKAGAAVTNGNGNILLGYQAGDAITTGARNIVIGYDIDAPSATGGGQLTIGNLIYGNGLTATSGTTVSGGKVGINKAQPSYTLDVNGTVFVKNLIVTASEYDNGNSGANLTINWSNGNKQLVTLSADVTSITLTPPPGVGNLVLRIVQDATTPRTVTGWPVTVKWTGGSYTATNTTSAVDIISCYYNGTSYYCQAMLNFS